MAPLESSWFRARSPGEARFDDLRRSVPRTDHSPHVRSKPESVSSIDRMMIDHETRLSIARERHDLLRKSMLASRRKRRWGEGDVPATQETAHIYAFPKARTQAHRGAAA